MEYILWYVLKYFVAPSLHLIILGTCIYMSPERIKGQPHSFDSDIWAFGITIAEAFLGFFPFILHSNASIWDVMNFLEQTNEAPFPLDGASDDFKDFVYSMLRFNRKDRPSAASLLEHPFITKYKHKKPRYVTKSYINLLNYFIQLFGKVAILFLCITKTNQSL